MARIPRSIGPYRLLEQLGSGGMGVVYRAQRRDTGHLVALKTVRVPRRGELAAIRREIHTLARMRHPGIVPILEEGLHRGVPWYAMELLQGSTLRQFLIQETPEPATTSATGASNRWWTHSLEGRPSLESSELASEGPGSSAPAGSRMSARAASAIRGECLSRLPVGLRLIHQLCAPLGFLHGEGLVHCDLKPENILLVAASGQRTVASDEPEQDLLAARSSQLAASLMPVLVDFGIVSRFTSELSREQLELIAGPGGTAAYMAPERILGELCDARADLYSVGCLLYELCTGMPPFLGPGAVKVLRQHIEAEPMPPSSLTPGLPAELDSLILRLLEKQPQRRMGFADDVAAALASVLQGLEPSREVAQAAPANRAYLYRPRFVGREKLMAELHQRLDRAEEGSGAVVLLAGESGAGKTRLLMELAREAHGRSLHVLTGEAIPSTGAAVPLGALRRPLLMLADLCSERGPAEAARLLGPHGRILALYEPALARLLGQPPRAQDRDEPSNARSAEAARFRLFQALAEAFAALSKAEMPGSAAVLLVLDDLHWADELTLEFVLFLARAGAQDRSLLVVGAYRTEEAGGNDASPLRRLLDDPGPTHLRVERLGEGSVGAMVTDMLAMPAPPALFVRFLTRQTEGNAFFVAEYLRAAIAEDVLYRGGDGNWHVVEPSPEATTEEVFEALRLPGSLRSLVAQRLDGLGAGARRYAEAAAVLGREIEEALAGRMARLGTSSRMEAVRELLSRQVMEEAGAGRLRFAHDKLREVAYERLTKPRRVRLHRSAAEVLEAHFGPESAEHQAALAHHWQHAGVAQKARPCHLAAARGAVQRYAHTEAERSYRSFLALSNRPASAEDIDARNELGSKVLRVQGRLIEANREYELALVAARQLKDLHRQQRTLRLMGDVFVVTGRVKEARATYRRALRLIRSREDCVNEIDVLVDLADIARNLGDPRSALELLEQAYAIALPLGHPHANARVLQAMAIAHAQLGHFEEAQSSFERCLEIWRQTGDRFREAGVLMNLTNVKRERGQMTDVAELFQQALKLFAEVGDRPAMVLLLNNLANFKADLGEPLEARDRYEQAFALAREIGDLKHMSVSQTNRAEMERRLGELATAQVLLQDAQPRLRTLHDSLFLTDCLCQCGHLALASGQPARPLLALAEESAAGLRVHPAAPVALALGRLRRAIDAFEAGQPLFRGEIFQDIPEAFQRWLLATDPQIESATGGRAVSSSDAAPHG